MDAVDTINYPQFCQFCGWNELERNLEEFVFTCHRCGRIVYLHSKLAVCAVIIRNHQVLLVRTSGDTSWDLPGGFLLYGESPEDGLKRELEEELNAKIGIERLLTALVDIYGNNNEFTMNLFYRASLISDKIRVGAEIEDYKWFNLNKLPYIKYKSTYEALSDIERYESIVE